MSDTPLLTIREIAQDLQLPESTVRYYRDAFPEHVATVGTGRRRRYPPEAVAVLRSIAAGYARGQSREEIEAELFGGPPPTRARPRPRPAAPASDELLATILDGERERREAMWQIAREIVRLGEAIERQQVVLGELGEQLAAQANRTLPPGPPPAEDEVAPTEPGPAATVERAVELGAESAPTGGTAVRELEQELRALRTELANERELVERLRKSKLDIERRAAEAEEQLGDRGGAGKRRSVFERLLSREEEGDG